MLNLVATTPVSRTRLTERLANYFAHVPEASREQFLLEALEKEIGQRERQFNGGQPWSAAPRRSFRPEPPLTLPSEDVHDWLCQRLRALEQSRPRSRRRAGWLW